MIAARKPSSAISCAEPLLVPRVQVRWVRRRHFAVSAASRVSSRPSAPNAFTTGLQEIASASAPPTRVSHWLESRAEGPT